MKSISARWGVLGAGRIAQQFVGEIGASSTGVLAGVASTDLARATALAATSPDAVAYGDYTALLADGDIDAVYIATLHPTHRDLIEPQPEDPHTRTPRAANPASGCTYSRGP